jgi:hypothetical protein
MRSLISFLVTGVASPNNQFAALVKSLREDFSLKGQQACPN